LQVKKILKKCNQIIKSKDPEVAEKVLSVAFKIKQKQTSHVYTNDIVELNVSTAREWNEISKRRMSERGLEKLTKIAGATARRTQLEQLQRDKSLKSMNHQEVRKNLREEITKKIYKIRTAQDLVGKWFYAILTMQAAKRWVALVKQRRKDIAWQSKVFWIQVKLKMNLAMMVKNNGHTKQERNRRKIKHCISSIGEITAFT